MEDYMDILLVAIPILIAILGNTGSKDKKSQKNKKYKKTSSSRSNIFLSQSTTSVSTLSNEAEKWRILAKDNIEKARGRVKTEVKNKVLANAERYLNNSQTVYSNDLRSSSEQIRQRRAENQHTSILERAKENVREFEKDVTLHKMETEHRHSERVAPAMHIHEDILSENILGDVEDLMVKGYSGTLCFERDFLGEGMDMISNFTVPTDIPEFSFSEI